MISVDRTLSVDVKDSLLDPDSSERIAQFRKGPAGETLYKLCIYLDGPDLPFVQEVLYDLHETFSPPTRRVTRSVSNPRCKLVIWTWGIFTIKAIITTKLGDRVTLSHPLAYGQEISSPSPTTKFQAV